MQEDLEVLSSLEGIAEELCQLVARKHHDYGESFDRLLEEYGPVGFLVRIADKYYRLRALLHEGRQQLVDESVEDTVRDLAGYCLLYLRWIRKRNSTVGA